MGLSASFEYICDVISRSYKHKLKKKKMMKEMQTVNLKVRMDCDGCELKVKKALSSLSGMKRTNAPIWTIHYVCSEICKASTVGVNEAINTIRANCFEIYPVYAMNERYEKISICTIYAKCASGDVLG
ncbi:uncharacterized protein LOC131021793 isoform X2 [Salvia miltiorrhiza]|uniref:uncharacterized protein LOC131021793 isoform X2 n=1 Tax=Salvia miltiorrhiza TaxID=226208 RepID=UPI0025AB6F8A|nr:uncharacterized protein LOC131021793 isoform X2 [Salvia miltiorrhiza]